jgi:hypothetical protein
VRITPSRSSRQIWNGLQENKIENRKIRLNKMADGNAALDSGAGWTKDRASTSGWTQLFNPGLTFSLSWKWQLSLMMTCVWLYFKQFKCWQGRQALTDGIYLTLLLFIMCKLYSKVIEMLSHVFLIKAQWVRFSCYHHSPEVQVVA